MLYILGAGGFAREVYFHTLGSDWKIDAFIDDVTEFSELELASNTLPVVKKWADLTEGEFLIGVGDPSVKRAMVSKALEAGLKPAPTFVHPRAEVQDAKIGKGGIITPGCMVTTNVFIGDYVILNLNTTVGHDAIIRDYATCNPGCSVSGNVTLLESVNLGTGTVVRDGIRVAPGVTAGAQSCIVKDVEDPGSLIAGVPAKKLK